MTSYESNGKEVSLFEITGVLKTTVCLSGVLAAIMVLSEVAGLADTPCVELPISVFAFGGQFVTTFGVVAILAHSRGVVLLVDVLAFGDLLAMLDPLV